MSNPHDEGRSDSSDEFTTAPTIETKGCGAKQEAARGTDAVANCHVCV